VFPNQSAKNGKVPKMKLKIFAPSRNSKSNHLTSAFIIHEYQVENFLTFMQLEQIPENFPSIILAFCFRWLYGTSPFAKFPIIISVFETL